MDDNKSLLRKELLNILELCECDETLFNDGIEQEIIACAENGLKILDEGVGNQKVIMIKLKDLCDFKDNFEYKPYLVVADDEFKKKLDGLKNVCKNYSDFEEVTEYVKNNFKYIEFDEEVIEI